MSNRAILVRRMGKRLSTEGCECTPDPVTLFDLLSAPEGHDSRGVLRTTYFMLSFVSLLENSMQVGKCFQFFLQFFFISFVTKTCYEVISFLNLYTKLTYLLINCKKDFRMHIANMHIVQNTAFR